MNKYLIAGISILTLFACNSANNDDESILHLNGKTFENNILFNETTNTWEEAGSCFIDELSFDSNGNFTFSTSMNDLSEEKSAGDSICHETIYNGKYVLQDSLLTFHFNQGYQYKGAVYLEDMSLSDTFDAKTKKLDFYHKDDLPSNLKTKIGSKGGKLFIQDTTFFSDILLERK